MHELITQPVKQSAWVGGIPCEPRSSSVSARPVPNNCSQILFTIVLAVSGFFWMSATWQAQAGYGEHPTEKDSVISVHRVPPIRLSPTNCLFQIHGWPGACQKDYPSSQVCSGTLLFKNFQNSFLYSAYPSLLFPGNISVK